MSWVELEKADIQNLQELKQFVQNLPDVFGNRFCCLLMGDLAAGKTEFVRQYCELFGIEESASPTYALHHRYSAQDITVDHFDLYRLKTGSELEGIGFWDIVQNSDKLFIEWPKHFSEKEIASVHENLFLVNIEAREGRRSITLSRWN